MRFRLAALAASIVLATPSVAAAQAIGCDQSECGEIVTTTTTATTTTSTTSTTFPTTSTSTGERAIVEVPSSPATTGAPAPTGGLPVTGADLAVLSVAGLAAIALGAGLRRRATR